jgi:hypothetical protein
LFDPDLAGLPSIDVLLRSASGDIETITLGANGNLGRFLNMSVNARAGGNVVVAPRNGVLEIPAATTLSVEYVDQRSGVVGRTQNVSSECGGIPSGYQSAQLSCSANTTLSDLANFVTQPRAVPAQITLVDPDLALTNPAFINVTVRNSLGDSETVRLDPQGAGRYGANSLPMTFAAATPGNGNLGFNQPGTISVDYTDTTTASGSPQALNNACGSVTPGFTLARLSVSFPGITARSVPARSSGTTQPISIPCGITVTDPDLTAATVTVQLTTAGPAPGPFANLIASDRETITLNRTSAGVYEFTACRYDGFVPQGFFNDTLLLGPVLNNNTINLGGGATTITVTYTDTTTPSGGAQQVSRSTTVSN